MNNGTTIRVSKNFLKEMEKIRTGFEKDYNWKPTHPQTSEMLIPLIQKHFPETERVVKDKKKTSVTLKLKI